MKDWEREKRKVVVGKRRDARAKWQSKSHTFFFFFYYCYCTLRVDHHDMQVHKCTVGIKLTIHNVNFIV